MTNWIEKQRHILDFTLSSLSRRLGKNLSLLLVYTTLVFVLASLMFLTHALKREATLALANAPDVVIQRMVAGRHDLIPAEYIETLAAIRGVRGVHGRLWGYYFDPIFANNYTVIVPGRFGHSAGSIMIGEGIARARLVERGDVLAFRGYDGAPLLLKVAFVMPDASALVSSDLILLGEQDFRRLFDFREGYFTDLVLDVPNSREIDTVAAKIVRSLPNTRTITRREILRTYDAIFSWRSGLIVVILSSAVLAFIIFAWDKASGLSAEERKEIGILKAIGWETSDVLLMKFWEGATVSLTSFLAGVLLAYVHVFFTSVVLFEPVLKGWSTLYPSFKLVPFISPYQVAMLFFLTVVPYTVATIVPSWRAATIDPDSVMRS